MHAKAILCAVVVLGVSALPPQIPSHAPATDQRDARSTQRVVIAASTVLDGKGNVLRDTRIVVEGGKIVAVDPKAEPVTYDLRGLTVMPGWIDSHVHISWIFDEHGRNKGQQVETQADAYRAASNAYATLLAGFTTVQSVGAPADIPLRDAINRGEIPGPRILTANEPLYGQGEKTGTPEEIRAFIRKQKAAGADLIKIFASAGIRTGDPTLSQEQLNAACDEAKKQGLRTLVHAFRDSVRMATLAGCTQVEHGLGASDDDLKLMAERGTILDPQAGLVLENYIANKAHYPDFTEETFAAMPALIPRLRDFVRHATHTPGLKVVFGTDATAGAHGRNAEEFIDRVNGCGVEPMSALVSAHSLAAQALGMANEIGSIAPGLQADIIALDGDPRKDITSVRRVAFVMKGGVVYKNIPRAESQPVKPLH